MQTFNIPISTLKAGADDNASNRNTGAGGLMIIVLIIKKDTLDAAENRKANSRTVATINTEWGVIGTFIEQIGSLTNIIH